jgi:hypothetical protein
MLDHVAHECERIDSRFLEPACGNGNFLAEVLRRKLQPVDKRNARNRDKWERDAILSECTLYGVDLLADNIAACWVSMPLTNGVPAVQIELKTRGITPRREIEQIVEYKDDREMLCNRQRRIPDVRLSLAG